MKRCSFVILVCFTFMISGCNNTQSFNVPKTDQPMAIVAHVKKQEITFLDVVQNQVLGSEDSHFLITEMVSIENGTIVATSQSEDSLLLYNIEKRSVSPFLKLNQGLTAIQYDQTSRNLFVTDIVNDQVHQIDMKREELVQSIEVDSYPTDLEFGFDELFVLSGERNHVTVTDLKLQTTLQTFPVLERPSGMYYDGENLWIGGHGSFGELNKRILAYDPNTGREVNEIEVGLMPIDFFGDRNSPYFYVLCHGDHGLYKVNKETNEVEDVIEVGQNPNFVTGNEDRLFVTNLDGNSLSIIDRHSFELIEEVPVATGPYAIILLED
ncbi:hypothetical protein [Halalkalibacter alkalisediminis]|uniref:YncE family protein n=1 Tax=Halalkalibacter alkalisediminis TaxID=935616 RepID=A0ABV6NDP8_9BACI|nr:hypothetical protein [Halalkalibacter alkalisediminis]